MYTILAIVSILVLMIVYYFYINYYNIKGQMCAAKGMPDKALFYFKKAYDRKPNVNNTMQYGYLLLRGGDFEEAERIINSAFLLSKITEADKDRARMMLALIKWKSGNLEEAISLYEALLEKGENTTVYANLGFLYIESGDMEKAFEFNKAAYEYNDANNVIADNYAECCVALGDEEKAFEILKKAVNSSMPIAENYYHFAKLLAKRKDFEEAERYLNLAKSMSINSLSGITSDDIKTLEEEIVNENR